nr:hypothetical protein [Flavobacteriaceae bacterium]
LEYIDSIRTMWEYSPELNAITGWALDKFEEKDLEDNEESRLNFNQKCELFAHVMFLVENAKGQHGKFNEIKDLPEYYFIYKHNREIFEKVEPVWVENDFYGLEGLSELYFEYIKNNEVPE